MWEVFAESKLIFQTHSLNTILILNLQLNDNVKKKSLRSILKVLMSSMRWDTPKSGPRRTLSRPFLFSECAPSAPGFVFSVHLLILRVLLGFCREFVHFQPSAAAKPRWKVWFLRNMAIVLNVYKRLWELWQHYHFKNCARETDKNPPWFNLTGAAILAPHVNVFMSVYQLPSVCYLPPAGVSSRCLQLKSSRHFKWNVSFMWRICWLRVDA